MKTRTLEKSQARDSGECRNLARKLEGSVVCDGLYFSTTSTRSSVENPCCVEILVSKGFRIADNNPLIAVFQFIGAKLNVLLETDKDCNITKYIINA